MLHDDFESNINSCIKKIQAMLISDLIAYLKGNTSPKNQLQDKFVEQLYYIILKDKITAETLTTNLLELRASGTSSIILLSSKMASEIPSDALDKKNIYLSLDHDTNIINARWIDDNKTVYDRNLQLDLLLNAHEMVRLFSTLDQDSYEIRLNEYESLVREIFLLCYPADLTLRNIFSNYIDPIINIYDYCKKYKTTPLLLSCQNNDIDLARRILNYDSKEINIEGMTSFGKQTPLLTMISLESVEEGRTVENISIIVLLIKKGASLDGISLIDLLLLQESLVADHSIIKQIGSELNKIEIAIENVKKQILHEPNLSANCYTEAINYISNPFKHNCALHCLYMLINHKRPFINLDFQQSLILYRTIDEDEEKKLSLTSKEKEEYKHVIVLQCLTSLQSATLLPEMYYEDIFLLNRFESDEHYRHFFTHHPVLRSHIKEELKYALNYLLEDKNSILCFMLYEFLDKDRIPSIMNHLNNKDIVFQLVDLILHPEYLEQGDKSLCGMAAFCMQLLNDAPEKFVQLTLDLLVYGKTHQPISLESTQLIAKTSNTVVDFILKTLRHNMNLVLSYTFNSSSSTMEGLSGASRPRELVELLAACGYTHIRDTTLVHSKTDTEVPSFFNKLLGGIYSKQHVSIPKREANLTHLLRALSFNIDDVAILLTFRTT